METYNTTGIENEQAHPIINTGEITNDAFSGPYREPNNFDIEEFDNLGGLHYMNYLHANDDML